MSLRDIITKFDEVKQIERDDCFLLVSKAVDDNVYRVIKYRYQKPLRDGYTLISVEFFSEEKAKRLGYLDPVPL